MLKGTALAVLSCALAISVRAQTYFLMSEMTNSTVGPPYPMNPYSSCPVYSQGENKYWVDDRYSFSRSFSSASMMSADSISPSDTNGNSTNYDANGLISPMDLSYVTNGSLWIEAYSNDTQNIYLQLHNTTNTEFYQILSTTNVASPSVNWTPGEVQNGKIDTNVTIFTAVPMTNAQSFFRGQQGNTRLFVSPNADAYETNATLGIPGQPGSIVLFCDPGVANPLTVHYTLSGTARNGIDYTNLSGVATIPGGSDNTVSVYVQPISPTTLTNPTETVDFAIQPGTNYLVAPFQYTGTVLIKSSSTTVSVQASGVDAIRPFASGQPEQNGSIFFSRLDDFNLYPPVTVYYQLTGTASNGVDYQLLSGSFVFAQDSQFTNITIAPLAENPPQGTKTVTATLISSNGYEADSNNFSSTISIYDQTNTFGITGAAPAINSDGPPGAPAADGSFTISRSEPHGFYPATTVSYSVSGEAVDGVDYTHLSGTVTFSDGQLNADIPVMPIAHWTNASKTVVMTLLPGDYVIDTSTASVTNFIYNSSTQISVSRGQDAVESQDTNSAQPGIFNITRFDPRGYSPSLSIRYVLSGTAGSGVDYSNLTGVITFAAGPSQTNLYVWPITNSGFPGDKSVTLTILPATNYFVDITSASASLLILDDTIQFQTVTNLGQFPGPVGIEYDPYLTNLLISGGETGKTFSRLGTNIALVGGTPVTNLFMTNWSGISGLPDEVYMTVVTNNNSGFTNGDMFFGSATGIGWLSSNAARSNLNWCILTNAEETNALLLRGGLCMDTVGTFSNNLVAVTSDDALDYGTKGIWEVDKGGHPTLLAHIDAYLLEGITVVRTNFGPWSGKIITGDEWGSESLFTIDASGNVTTNDSTALFPGGIRSESSQIIPPNQSLYLCDPSGPIAKLPKSYFTNYVGDLLIEDAGENGSAPAKLFIIHWNAATTNFITRRIRYAPGGDELEHSVFAPIELPAH